MKIAVGLILLGALALVTHTPTHMPTARATAESAQHVRSQAHVRLYVPAILQPGHASQALAVECADNTRQIIVADLHSGIRLPARWNHAHDLMTFGHRPVTFDGLTFRNMGGRAIFALVVC